MPPLKPINVKSKIQLKQWKEIQLESDEQVSQMTQSVAPTAPNMSYDAKQQLTDNRMLVTMEERKAASPEEETQERSSSQGVDADQ